jgi:prefoldin subunit 5
MAGLLVWLPLASDLLAQSGAGAKPRTIISSKSDEIKRYNKVARVLKEKVSGLENKIKTLSGRISSLKNTNANLAQNIKNLESAVNRLNATIATLKVKVRELEGKNFNLLADLVLTIELGAREISRLEGRISLLKGTMQKYTRVIQAVRDTLFVRSFKVMAVQKRTLFNNRFTNVAVTANWNNEARVKASRVKTLILLFDTGIEYSNPQPLYYTIYYRKRAFESVKDTTGFKVISDTYKDKRLVFDYERGQVTVAPPGNNNNTSRSRTTQEQPKPGYKVYKRGRGAQKEKFKRGAYIIETYYTEDSEKKHVVDKKGRYLFYFK